MDKIISSTFGLAFVMLVLAIVCILLFVHNLKAGSDSKPFRQKQFRRQSSPTPTPKADLNVTHLSAYDAVPGTGDARKPAWMTKRTGMYENNKKQEKGGRSS